MGKYMGQDEIASEDMREQVIKAVDLLARDDIESMRIGFRLLVMIQPPYWLTLKCMKASRINFKSTIGDTLVALDVFILVLLGLYNTGIDFNANTTLDEDWEELSTIQHAPIKPIPQFETTLWKEWWEKISMT